MLAKYDAVYPLKDDEKFDVSLARSTDLLACIGRSVPGARG